MKENHIVLTTINFPSLLREYRRNLLNSGELDTTKVWIVGDRKTPPSVYDLAAELTNSGLETIYLDMARQDEWGKGFPSFYNRIPYNNETRRNIGFLQALQEGCSRLISIDDDNWPTDDNFALWHSRTGQEWKDHVVYDESGFLNVCEYIHFVPSRPIFPRGYPFLLRGATNNIQHKPLSSAVTVGVTAGLWLREPDIDATTWLNGKVEGTGYLGPDVMVLDQSTWSPINTQNTSVVRELIPAYLCVPMGWDVPGGKIQRYGDIWGGYFLQSVMSSTKYNIAIGRPLVDHRRNPHNYLDDLRQEFWGMILTDWLLNLLRSEFKSPEQDICDKVECLAEFLLSTGIRNLPSWCAAEVKEFIEYTAGNLSLWAKVCRQIR